MSTTTIAVFGATGNQGGAVVRSLAASSKLAKKVKIQAVTRDPSSDKSKALSNIPGGEAVEPIKIDLDSLASDNADCLKGVDVVFANTNTFEGGPEKEVARGKALIDAAKKANVGLFVWSTLPSAKEMSSGKYTEVEHFEAKAKVTEYLKASGIKWTALSLGWFAENIPTFHMVQKDGSDAFKVNYSILKPDTKVAWTWVASDLGPAAAAVIEAHVTGADANVFNRIIPAAGYQASMGDFVAAVEKASGLKGSYVELPPFGNGDIDDMHRLYNDHGLYQGQTLPDPELVKLGVKFSTIDDVVKALALPALK
ncbi:NAD(P)-binding protein [Microstroma glucosiphilum]|uniref:NAD(P)-binding protein n=1 Tax=Pseudomicrostroma glucosiphilum TaxID=1684307 RepID=A0A316UDV9_9BASI|nr:NAD(P)-binding protein [Pseudomicrostroma glucosiphilum]PWN23447.1 NAD(P)-binding protein [Pseudomicrostroma glucosiphilum]